MPASICSQLLLRQKDAVQAKYVLNPLEKYFNVVSNMRADGETLVAMDGKVTLKIFVDRLQKHNRSALVSQEADFIVDHLRQVCEEMPSMIQQQHQIKHLVVEEKQQAVYSLGGATDLFPGGGATFRSVPWWRCYVKNFNSDVAASPSEAALAT